MINSYVSAMTTCVLEQVKQSSKFRKGRHFMVLQPLKPGRDSTYALLRCYHIQNLSRYIVPIS